MGLTQRTSRRDFLRGKPIAGVGSAPAGAVPGQSPSEATEESYLVTYSRAAMACQFEVVLRVGQYPNGSEAAIAALDLVDRLEGQLSFFRPDSQISRLNVLAADQPVEVSQDLFDLLALAADLHRQTGGALDITSTPLWEVWGFARREGRVPTKQELADARRLVGGDRVELDPVRKTVRFTQPGVRLSLGCLGKGYALDRAAVVLSAAGIGDFLLPRWAEQRAGAGVESGFRVRGSGFRTRGFLFSPAACGRRQRRRSRPPGLRGRGSKFGEQRPGRQR